MSTLSDKETCKITDFLIAHPQLSRGLGTRKSPCSVAAINLALTGELTDKIPNCMSVVVGTWIIAMQDAMPSEIRDSAEWRFLLPLAAGTGGILEKKRMEMALEWLWGTALTALQPVADEGGFGKEWKVMLTKRTFTSATKAYEVGDAAAGIDYGVFLAATDAADSATRAWRGGEVYNSLDQLDDIAEAVDSMARAVPDGGWSIIDPVGTLRKLIDVA